MKKILYTLLATFILLAALTSCGSKKTTEQDDNNVVESPATDFEYELSPNGDAVYIKRYIGNSEHIVIPSKINNLPVTCIEKHAFEASVVKSLKMPNSISKIGGGAFINCDKLEEISFSESLTDIGQNAFENCTLLKKVSLPSSLRNLGEMVFNNSGIEYLEIKEGVEVIPIYAFASTNLTTLVLPKSIKKIDFQAFAGCLKLENVILNDGLVEISVRAFAGDLKLKEITIPKTVNIVTEMSFSGCSGLKKVMFEGNAPASYEFSDNISGVWTPFNTEYTVYYHEGSKGFTSPEWYGYKTQIW